MPTQRRSPSFRAERRKQGEVRNKVWRALSPKEQLSVLNERFGPGKGAPRQRKRLDKQLVSTGG